MDYYAVVGNPIAHSKSPTIHRLFAEQTGQALTYEALLAPLDGFEDMVRQFQARGGRGMNVTLPFKEQAWELADSCGPLADRARAVNTLIFTDDGRIRGANTDGLGLVQDLCVNCDLTLRARRLLIVGAGGAVRGVLAPLLEQHPAKLVIANRTPARAEQLAEDFADTGPIQACSFEALDGQRFDLIINGTAASLSGELPPLPAGIVGTETYCYDMAYGSEPTVFQRWAHTAGAAGTWDGLGMLVEQAAESFLLWRGVRPATAPVIRHLRGEVAA
ncbi:MAG: shikimate dehydrogenase [Gammaproteobacteria bacterium]|jgi:shikimate dehydrogenase